MYGIARAPLSLPGNRLSAGGWDATGRWWMEPAGQGRVKFNWRQRQLSRLANCSPTPVGLPAPGCGAPPHTRASQGARGVPVIPRDALALEPSSAVPFGETLAGWV